MLIPVAFVVEERCHAFAAEPRELGRTVQTCTWPVEFRCLAWFERPRKTGSKLEGLTSFEAYGFGWLIRAQMQDWICTVFERSYNKQRAILIKP